MLSPLALPTLVPSASGGTDACEPANDRAMAREELEARLRFILPEALEAFGHARLVWVSAPWGTTREVESSQEGQVGFDGLSAKEWYDLCRSQLARMAVGGEALDAIFAGYVGFVTMFYAPGKGKGKWKWK